MHRWLTPAGLPRPRPPRRVGRALPSPILFLALVAHLLGGCRAPASPAAATAQAWGNGPARWLLLEQEQEALRGVRTNTDFASFLGTFWACRDDDPATDENPFGRLFAERVAAADRLYAEPGLRGSLTPRGGALLLLGPPTLLRYSERKAPAMDGTTTAGARPTKALRVEVWGYLPRDLPPALRQQLALDVDSRQELELVFLGGRHTRLLDGEELLAAAALAASHCQSP